MRRMYRSGKNSKDDQCLSSLECPGISYIPGGEIPACAGMTTERVWDSSIRWDDNWEGVGFQYAPE
jgi:hypothetical protein